MDARGVKKMTQKQKLNLSVVQQQNEQTYSGQRVIDFGNGYFVNAVDKFEPTKVQEMITEYAKGIYELAERKVMIDSVGYMFLMIVKHFTDFEVPDDLNKQIFVLNELVNSRENYLQKIIDGFDKDEVAMIEKMVRRATEMNADVLKQQRDNLAYQNSLVKVVEVDA